MITKSESETLGFAEQYAKTLQKGDVVLLYGDLGGILYHFDCYRLSCGAQAEALGLTDYFYAGGICMVEWPQNIADVLPDGCKIVRIAKLGENEREIVTE